MKKIMFIVLCLSALMCCNNKNENKSSVNPPEMKGIIKISGAFALLPLVQDWTTDFSKIYPDIKFEIINSGSDQGLDDILSEKADLGMISSDIPIEQDTLVWLAPVAKLAVVPFFNKKNPYYEEIMNTGITREELIALFSGTNTKIWAEKFGIKGNEPINIYIRSDKSGASKTFGKYLWLETKQFKGKGVEGDIKMIESVKADLLSIGYCNFVFLFDPETKDFINDISVIPFDLNSSGKIEDKEAFYGSYDMLTHAMWTGKYPCLLTRDLSLGTKGIPSNPIVKEFLKWVMTDGQSFVQNHGYIEVRPSVVKCKVEMLKLKDVE